MFQYLGTKCKQAWHFLREHNQTLSNLNARFQYWHFNLNQSISRLIRNFNYIFVSLNTNLNWMKNTCNETRQYMRQQTWFWNLLTNMKNELSISLQSGYQFFRSRHWIWTLLFIILLERLGIIQFFTQIFINLSSVLLKFLGLIIRFCRVLVYCLWNAVDISLNWTLWTLQETLNPSNWLRTLLSGILIGLINIWSVIGNLIMSV